VPPNHRSRKLDLGSLDQVAEHSDVVLPERRPDPLGEGIGGLIATLRGRPPPEPGVELAVDVERFALDGDAIAPEQKTTNLP
jgi:hypothetical protein